MTVNALRKASEDSEVIAISKQLIKKWKKFVTGKNNNLLACKKIIAHLPDHSIRNL